MNYEFKGTKGEWSSRISFDKKYNQPSINIYSTSGVDSLATIWSGDSDENAITDEIKANAQIIVCAPRLLEMLVSCVDLLEGLDVPDAEMETFGNLIMNARQTIIDDTNPDLCKR